MYDIRWSLLYGCLTKSILLFFDFIQPQYGSSNLSLSSVQYKELYWHAKDDA